MCAKDECTNVRENTRVRVYLSTHSVGYSGSLSTVNETNCNKKREIRARKNVISLPTPFGQLERWTSNLQRKLVLVVCVFVDLTSSQDRVAAEMLSALPSEHIVGGWYIAMVQYSSLCEGAAVLTLGIVDIGDGVPGRVQVECGREEMNDGEKQEKDKQEETDKEQPTNAQAHIMDDMKME